MKKILVIFLFFSPCLCQGQQVNNIQSIDSIADLIDTDPAIVRKTLDSSSWQREDGGDHWDSLYHHREIYYKNGQIVKIRQWTQYGRWRTDILVYYQNQQPIRFSKGESFKGQPYYGEYNFQIYYHKDKELQVTWLRPKPDNVIRVVTDTYLQWAYEFLTSRI